MDRIGDEKRVVEMMIRLYCRHKEGNASLCDSCSEILSYAVARLDNCRFGNDKPTCRKCPIHCYASLQRQRMREIMRWAGPRMMLFHPLTALRHAMRECRFK